MSSNPEKMDEKREINSTVSTKLSTDQLICKSPPSSVSTADGSNHEEKNITKSIPATEQTPIVLYLGLLQVLFGLLMAVFGVLVLIHESNLSQVCGRKEIRIRWFTGLICRNFYSKSKTSKSVIANRIH